MGYRIGAICCFFNVLCWGTLLLLVTGNSAHASVSRLKIGMLLWRGETVAEAGFKDRLSVLGYRVEYVIFDSGQSPKRLGEHLSSITADIESYDYIYTFGTTVSRRAKLVVAGRIPQLFNIVTDPVASGIADSLERPGKNISGASDFIPVSRQLSAAQRMFPVEKLGFFYNPREKNSMIYRKELLASARERGVGVIEFRIPPKREALMASLQGLAENPGLVDAVCFAADSYLSSEAKLIGTELLKVGIKSVGTVHEQIENGVLLGVVADYYRLGAAVADMLDRHQRGDELGMIPVERAGRGILMVNGSTADMMGIDVDAIDDEDVLIVE